VDGKIDYSLIPIRPLRELGRVYNIGAAKHGAQTWREGVLFSNHIAALYRHLLAFIDGQDIDPDDGQLHLGSVAWRAFSLIELAYTHPELDDRIKSRPPFLYLSGSMSREKDLGYARFQKETTRLRKAGYNVFSPAEVELPHPPTKDNRSALIANRKTYLHRDYAVISDSNCIGVAVMKDSWKVSSGVRAELAHSAAIGRKVLTVNQWVKRKR